MTFVSMAIVRFCAIECKLQMSGEMSVLHMIEAWQHTEENLSGRTGDNVPVSLTVSDVIDLGRMVEPIDNALGFRRVGVWVGSDTKMDWHNVPSAMVNLVEGIDALTPAEFFKEYEEIHPFRDGNGRTGAILFNLLNGTMDDPVWPPNFWNDPRRTVGHGA